MNRNKSFNFQNANGWLLIIGALGAIGESVVTVANSKGDYLRDKVSGGWDNGPLRQRILCEKVKVNVTIFNKWRDSLLHPQGVLLMVLL